MRVLSSLGIWAAALVSVMAHDKHPTVTCKVELGWNPSGNEKSSLNMYRLEVKASDNTFKPIVG